MEEYDDLVGGVDSEGTLDISHKDFNEIDENVWDFEERLKILNVSFNRIHEICGGVARLQFLTVLDASCNRLDKLCPEIGECVRLKTLKLNGNKLKTIPEEIGQLRILEELYLSENEIETVPESIGKLKSLRVVTLQNNKLKELDAALGECISIESLDCSNNPDLINIPQNLLDDTATMMWMLAFQRGLIKNFRDMKKSNIELEQHAKLADKTRVANSQLKVENDKLRKLVDKYEDERPEIYLKIKSKVCVIM